MEYPTFLKSDGHYWPFQCDPWCLPTQNWLKTATNDISIQESHNITRHYIKDTGRSHQSFSVIIHEMSLKLHNYEIFTKGLRLGLIPSLDLYLKKVRNLSRQQFYLRATMIKARQKSGLDD